MAVSRIVSSRLVLPRTDRIPVLYVIATLPEYRGQGIASALIGHGINEAVSEGLKSFWLDASDDGHSVYEKYGFRDVESIEKDIAKYGGRGKATIIGMKKTIA